MALRSSAASMLLPGSPPSPVVACANAVSDPPPGLASIAGGSLRQRRERPSWLACLSSSCGLDMPRNCQDVGASSSTGFMKKRWGRLGAPPLPPKTKHYLTVPIPPWDTLCKAQLVPARSDVNSEAAQ